ncbi:MULTISPECIES: hypothetical protein [unclassified Streptomyces]|uniref:hypothetical protein n=1 Tax=unclassified Streptomyces TaxID=2593676 RepID=UPI0033175AF4
MGNMHYEIWRNGQKIEAGYGVPDVCNTDGCKTDIDRGLAHLCGKTPGGDEHGCGGYHCASHLYMSLDDEVGDLCGQCIAVYRRERATENA